MSFKIVEFSQALYVTARSLARIRACSGYSWIAHQINLPSNQKGYDTSETTIGKLSVRRIQIYPDYFCLGIILKLY